MKPLEEKQLLTKSSQKRTLQKSPLPPEETEAAMEIRQAVHVQEDGLAGFVAYDSYKVSNCKRILHNAM